MVVRFENMWISVPALLIPILFVSLLMLLIRIWTFSAPRWSRPIPSYSLHVMKDLPGHSTVDTYPSAHLRQSLGRPSAGYTSSKAPIDASMSIGSSVFGTTAPAPASMGYELKNPPSQSPMYYFEPGSRGVPQSIRRTDKPAYEAEFTDTTFDQESDSTSSMSILKKPPLFTDFL